MWPGVRPRELNWEQASPREWRRTYKKGRATLTHTRSGRRLEVAAWAFAGATLLGSVVSMRDNVPGEPLGIRVPLSIPTALLAGWGGGVAAPWPMAVAAVVAATARTSAGTRALICAGIGVACIAGTLVEPVTRQPRTWTVGMRLAILANMTTSVAMIAIGLLTPHRGSLGSDEF